MNKGVLYGILAYLCWGFFPLYFKLLQNVPAIQILAHRIFWSFILLVILAVARREVYALRVSIHGARLVGLYLLAACLLAVNWLIYIWGVNAGYILEASLGYFINPLLSVLLGVIFLHERLRPLQWVPLGLAALGVIYLTISYGRLPWIALSLAFSFGLYGLVKKTAPLNSFYGLTLETGLLFLPAAGLLLAAELQGVGALGHVDGFTNLVLISAGVVTAVPLLMFGSAARSIPLSTLGVLQYITPTGQFLIGVLVYHEAFTPARLIGFGLIWLALILFWSEGALAQRKRAAAAQAG